MESLTNSPWKPDASVLRWAWVALIPLPLLFGVAGALSLFLSSYTIGAIAVVVGVVAMFTLMVLFFRAVGRSQLIPASIRRLLRRNLLLFGPVAMAQLLVYNYFPNSGFSGLGGGGDERTA